MRKLKSIAGFKSMEIEKKESIVGGTTYCSQGTDTCSEGVSDIRHQSWTDGVLQRDETVCFIASC